MAGDYGVVHFGVSHVHVFVVEWFSCGSVAIIVGASWFSSWLIVIRVWFSCGSVVVHVGV